MLQTVYDFLLMFVLPFGIGAGLESVTGVSADVWGLLIVGAEVAACVFVWRKWRRPMHKIAFLVALWFFNLAGNFVFFAWVFKDLSI